MRILRFLLFPLALLYDMMTHVRNYLYDIGHKRSFEFSVPVISVGNLNTGGSGKTPMIEYLVRLLKRSEKIATLSRGYGRTTRGLRFAGDDDTALTLGDEPFQFYKKFGREINVVVGEDRAFAIPNILHEHTDTTVILLDDAFQHRSVKPQYSILVTEYSKPFYNDYVLPMGNLREGRRGVSRANVIVVTKCPEVLSQDEMTGITSEIKRYTPAPVFFSNVAYGELVQFAGPVTESFHHVILVSGIAQATAFEKQCAGQFHVIRHFRFADHHRYTQKEVEEIRKFAQQQSSPVSIITTEKDMARLSAAVFKEMLAGIACYYLPIEMVFMENGSEFDKEIVNATNLPEQA